MERLPKHEYFQLRLTQAIEDGNIVKAEYYCRRTIGYVQRDKPSSNTYLTRRLYESTEDQITTSSIA